MSPIELLKDGIGNGDWSGVCDAYRALTGERLDPPAPGQDLSAVRERIDAVFSEMAGPAKTGKTKRNPKKTTKTTKAKTPETPADGLVESGKAGSMTIFTNTPDEEEIRRNSELVAKRPPTPRRVRRTYDLECDSCHRTFQSDRQPLVLEKGHRSTVRCPECERGARG